MEKYRRGLVGEIKQELEQEEEQERLHEKYQEQDPDVVIVETSNTMKFLIRWRGGENPGGDCLISFGSSRFASLSVSGNKGWFTEDLRTDARAAAGVFAIA